jgi:hypothetical protein
MNGEFHAPAALPVEKNKCILWIAGQMARHQNQSRRFGEERCFTSVGFRTTDNPVGSYTSYAIPARSHDYDNGSTLN